MENEKRNQYAKVLINAYENGIIKIVWSTSGFSLAVDPQRRMELPEVDNKEFIHYAFDVVKKVIDMADGKEINGEEPDDVEIARKIFELETDLKNHLYIKRHSIMDCYKLLEYEMISHRNPDNPFEIGANGVILKIHSELRDEDEMHMFELSHRDLKEMISKLTEIDQKLSML